MEIDGKQIILQIINFAILLVVLKRFLYKPILQIMDARSKKIQEGLEAAEKSLEDQAKTQEKQKDILAVAEKKATAILNEARNEAKKLSKEIVSSARNEAKNSIDKEYKILTAKLDAQEQKVRGNIAKVVAQATRTVLQKSLSDSAHHKIIKTQIQNLKSLKN